MSYRYKVYIRREEKQVFFLKKALAKKTLLKRLLSLCYIPIDVIVFFFKCTSEMRDRGKKKHERTFSKNESEAQEYFNEMGYPNNHLFFSAIPKGEICYTRALLTIQEFIFGE